MDTSIFAKYRKNLDGLKGRSGSNQDDSNAQEINKPQFGNIDVPGLGMQASQDTANQTPQAPNQSAQTQTGQIAPNGQDGSSSPQPGQQSGDQSGQQQVSIDDKIRQGLIRSAEGQGGSSYADNPAIQNRYQGQYLSTILKGKSPLMAASAFKNNMGRPPSSAQELADWSLRNSDKMNQVYTTEQVDAEGARMQAAKAIDGFLPDMNAQGLTAEQSTQRSKLFAKTTAQMYDSVGVIKGLASDPMNTLSEIGNIRSNQGLAANTIRNIAGYIVSMGGVKTQDAMSSAIKELAPRWQESLQQYRARIYTFLHASNGEATQTVARNKQLYSQGYVGESVLK